MGSCASHIKAYQKFPNPDVDQGSKKKKKPDILLGFAPKSFNSP
jgi:hypothetical protein